MDRYHKTYLFLLIGCLLVLSACSTGKSAEEKHAATTPEGMVSEGPGKYAGEQYDEEKVAAELKNFPQNMDEQEAYDRLIRLLAEDYEPVIDEAKNYKPSYKLTKLGDFDPNVDLDPRKKEQKKQKNIVVLIDASGSMAGRVDGNTKMEEAKEAVKAFASSLPEDARLSLQVYGHKGSNRDQDKKLSCASTKEAYPLGKLDMVRFEAAVNQLEPVGWTPMAKAIREAGKSLSSFPDAKNAVYVVSDGIETCGGDPVREARQLHTSNIQAIVNIIGFDLDEESKKALKKVAEAGGGKFTDARSGEDIKRGLTALDVSIRSTQINLWSFENDQGIMWGKRSDNKKINKLIGTDHPLFHSQFVKILNKEINHLEDAVDILEEQQLVTRQVADGLKKRLETRKEQIRKFRQQLEDQKEKEFDVYYDRLRQRIKEIEQASFDDLDSKTK